jgi:hypothetical protein
MSVAVAEAVAGTMEETQSVRKDVCASFPLHKSNGRALRATNRPSMKKSTRLISASLCSDVPLSLLLLLSLLRSLLLHGLLVAVETVETTTAI